ASDAEIHIDVDLLPDFQTHVLRVPVRKTGKLNRNRIPGYRNESRSCKNPGFIRDEFSRNALRFVSHRYAGAGNSRPSCVMYSPRYAAKACGLREHIRTLAQ